MRMQPPNAALGARTSAALATLIAFALFTVAHRYGPNIAHWILTHAPFNKTLNLKGIAAGNACWGGTATSVDCNGPNSDQNDLDMYFGKALISKKLYTAAYNACGFGNSSGHALAARESPKCFLAKHKACRMRRERAIISQPSGPSINTPSMDGHSKMVSMRTASLTPLGTSCLMAGVRGGGAPQHLLHLRHVPAPQPRSLASGERQIDALAYQGTTHRTVDQWTGLNVHGMHTCALHQRIGFTVAGPPDS